MEQSIERTFNAFIAAGFSREFAVAAIAAGRIAVPWVNGEPEKDSRELMRVYDGRPDMSVD